MDKVLSTAAMEGFRDGLLSWFANKTDNPSLAGIREENIIAVFESHEELRKRSKEKRPPK